MEKIYDTDLVKQNMAAMRGVRANPPEGAVRKLVAVGKSIEWIWNERRYDWICPNCKFTKTEDHNTNCEWEAALSRFRIEGGEGT